DPTGMLAIQELLSSDGVQNQGIEKHATSKIPLFREVMPPGSWAMCSQDGDPQEPSMAFSEDSNVEDTPISVVRSSLISAAASPLVSQATHTTAQASLS
ncbi:Hypothetical predicted protein, partial [Pelobates cultripes]